MRKRERSEFKVQRSTSRLSQIDVRGGARVEEPDGAAGAAAHRGGGKLGFNVKKDCKEQKSSFN